MAGRISGITIEIGGDTTKLQKSLKDVDKELNETQSALKDVNKLLKLDPTNIDLLKQKQQDLRTAISLTKDRLNELKQAQEQFGKGTKEYDAIEREIAESESKLRDLQGEFNNLRSVAGPVLQEIGQKIQDVGQGMQDVGETLSKKVTAPLVAVAGASVVAWRDVDSAYDSVIAKTGATGDALAEMQRIVNDLGTSMPVSFGDAAKAVGEISTRFGVTGDQLSDLSRAFLQFSKINGTDVQSSVDGVSSAMAAFGMSADDAQSALDILNTVGQTTDVSVDSLIGLIQTAAPITRELGFNFGEAASFLGNLDKNGIDASAVMTGLRRALANATKDGKSMDEALADLQTSLANATSDTEAMQAATDLFGTKAAPALVQAIQDGRISFDELSLGVEDFGGSVASTFEATQDPLDGVQTAMNNLKLIGADLVDTAAPAITVALEKLGGVINKLSSWWGGLSEEQQQSILKIAGIVAAVGPALIVGGKLVSSIGMIVSALGSVVSVLGGPVTLAIGAIIGVGALLVTHWDEVKEAAAKVGAWVSEKWDAIKTKVSDAYNAMKAKASETWDNIKSVATEKVSAMKDMLQGKWDAIKGAYEKHGGGLKGVASAAVEGIKQYFTLGFDSLNTLLGGKLDGIKQKFTQVFDKLKSIVQNAVDKIKSVFNFNWSLPNIKLPHFRISGGSWPYGLGGQGSMPRIAIDWYRKAYDNPILFQNPTVIPTAAGLKGFGDGNGAEIVMGLERLRDLVGASGDTIVNVYGSPNMDVNELADAVQARLVALQKQREVAYA